MRTIQLHHRFRYVAQLALVAAFVAVGCHKSDRISDRAPSRDEETAIRREASPVSRVTVDLLDEITLPRDQILGDASLEAKTLVIHSDAPAQLALPHKPIGDYQLIAEIERVSGFGPCRIGLLAGDRATMLVLDGWETHLSGLDEVDGESARNNSTTYRLPTLPRGKPVTVECTVRGELISVRCDGKEIVNWKGNPQRLSVDSRFSAPGASEHLTIGGNDSEFRVSRLKLITAPGASVESPWYGGRVDNLRNAEVDSDQWLATD